MLDTILIVFASLFAVAVVSLAVYDLLQQKHSILRNFPVIGHFRYWLEEVGPELRQYIVTDNDEERPFSRDQRSWIYASSKQENNLVGFGSDNEMELQPNYLIIKHSAFPLPSPHAGDRQYDPQSRIPCAKVLGGYRGRKRAFRPQSVVNISAMSFGSLSAAAIEALNRGCSLAGCLQNSGEGGVSPHHCHGGELVWQIGTGYFGCRDNDGNFNMKRLLETTEKHPQIRAIEIKLSQGAKPGKGGILPRAKITDEIAEIRGIPRDRDCISPTAHSAFRCADSMLDFVEDIAETTGLPVGIKSAVGQTEFWSDLAKLIAAGDRAIDFVTIDGGEGGTGAAPLVFSDHIAFPFKQAFSQVHRIFAESHVQERVVFIGSGKVGFPESALFAFALGCDMVNVAREAMMSIGCIQAQRCHTGFCPAGVATQNKWLMRGLVPSLKSARLANYVVTLRRELLAVSRACGFEHPALLTPDHLAILDDRFGSSTLSELFGYEEIDPRPSEEDRKTIRSLMEEMSH